GHDPLPGGRVKDAYGAGYAGRAPARSLTRPPDRRTGSYRGAGSRPRHTQIRAATPPGPPIEPLAITGRYRQGGPARVLLEPSPSLSVRPSGRSLIVAHRLDAARLARACGLAARHA